jgi:hypothetical protein
MTGKKISSDMNGYLTSLNLKDAFMKALEALTLIPGSNRNHEELEELKQRLGKTEKGLSELREILQQLLEKESHE